MSMGTRLRALIEAKGYTQTTLAKTLGLSVSTLNGYVNDYREPDVKTLSRLAEELDVTVDYLINGTAADNGEEAYRSRVEAIAHSEGVQLTKEQEEAVARYMRFLVAEDRGGE